MWKRPDKVIGIFRVRHEEIWEQVSIRTESRESNNLVKNDYIHYTATSQNIYNEDLQNKLINKLPGPLGREIQESYRIIKQANKGTYVDNVVTLPYLQKYKNKLKESRIGWQTDGSITYTLHQIDKIEIKIIDQCNKTNILP